MPGAPGICLGTAVVIHPTAILESVPDRVADDVTVELMVFDRAINTVRDDILDIRKQLAQSPAAGRTRAVRCVPAHARRRRASPVTCASASRHGQWAQGALRQVIMEHVRSFERMEDPYLRERGADVKELGQRVLAYMQDLRQKKAALSGRTPFWSAKK